jgi:hypothetical protein
MTASAASKVYNLQIVGYGAFNSNSHSMRTNHESSGNKDIHGQKLHVTEDGTLTVQSQAASTPSRCSIEHHFESTLLRCTFNQTSTTEARFLTLQGPSGKEEYMLQESPSTEPEGIGSHIINDEWLIVEDGERLLLRSKDPKLSSHWVASKSDSTSEPWTFWWYCPNSANMEDLIPYVSVDIELVEVEESDGA